ncbi:Uncharacterised protein [Bordetella pertussis]|nr:Uncharacterised protein [Bordetella pertussis]
MVRPRPTAFCSTRKGISASSLRSAVRPMQPKKISSRVGLMLVSSEIWIPPQVSRAVARTANSRPPTMGSGML